MASLRIARVVQTAAGLFLSLGAAALLGCSVDQSPDAGPIFHRPAGTVPVGFAVDDSANRIFAQGDLEWKGGFDLLTPTSTVIVPDWRWLGPFPLLYDDGPWTAGGHEPAGATAGDHVWGITVFVFPPDAGTDRYPYGLQDAMPCSATSQEAGTCIPNGWKWTGANGWFDVPAGATAEIEAAGLTLSKFGNVDLQLTFRADSLDSFCALSRPASCSTNADCVAPDQVCSLSQCVLKTPPKCTGGVPCPAGIGAIEQSCVAPDTARVTVRCSCITWNEVEVQSDWRGNFTFTLSAYAGPGKTVPHVGLLNRGDKPEFVFVFTGNEYRDPSQSGSPANATGITASTTAAGASTFTPQLITLSPVNGNTRITVP